MHVYTHVHIFVNAYPHHTCMNKCTRADARSHARRTHRHRHRQRHRHRHSHRYWQERRHRHKCRHRHRHRTRHGHRHKYPRVRGLSMRKRSANASSGMPGCLYTVSQILARKFSSGSEKFEAAIIWSLVDTLAEEEAPFVFELASLFSIDFKRWRIRFVCFTCIYHVHMCLYMEVYIHIIQIRVCVYTYIYMYISTLVYIYIYLYICVHVYST